MTDRFQTGFRYQSRHDKPRYVWEKYREILKGKILDVGADQCGLKAYMPGDAEYLGVGLGAGVDMEVDLDAGPLPFSDNTYDCVLCLDVLEHLENVHFMFDELCRVSRRYLVISLPNPWKDFIRMLRHGFYRGSEQPMKFYNLPVNPPEDRHRWFYSPMEAERFIRLRGERNGMTVIQTDHGRGKSNATFKKNIYKTFIHKDIDVNQLFLGTQWTVLEKNIT